MTRPLRALPAVLALVAAACSGQCGARGGLPPVRPPLVQAPDGQKYYLLDRGPYQAFYDRWGHLQRIEYDSNKDGRPDQIAHHRGEHHARLLEVDEDFDGRMDRWEDYDADGTLVKIGVSRHGRGPDVWVYAGPDGQPRRKEYDEDGDGRVDRAEELAAGRVVRVELDTDRDGRMDRWQEWLEGRLTEERIDTDRDGRPDRRLRYGAHGEVVSLEPVARR
jgi:hypothetical protein